MQPRVVFEGLWAFGRSSITYLRVFEHPDRLFAALAVDPTDAPGTSAINAAEHLWESLQERFDRPDLALYVMCPGPGPWPKEGPWHRVRMSGGSAGFQPQTPAQLAGLVGAYALVPEAGDCRHFASDGDPLIAKLPPAGAEKEEERDPVDDLQLVDLAALPYHHSPFKCPHENRFKELPGGDADSPSRGERWFQTLAQDDFATCPYHQDDWTAIAAHAVALFLAVKARY